MTHVDCGFLPQMCVSAVEVSRCTHSTLCLKGGCVLPARCYCFECVDTLVGPGTSEKVHAMSNWVCFLCLPFPRSGLLQRRRKWRSGLKAFYDREAESPLEMYKTVPVWKREPIRVLSLFGNIKKELTSLGFLEDGSKRGRLKHLDDVTNVVRRDVDEWGPFDLTYGSTPALGHTCDHPPGWYVYQFHRILQYARPPPGSPQPFFWMFVDNLVLTEEDLDVATRFLETDPVTIQDVHGRTVQNAVHVWSNIPAVKRYPCVHQGPGGLEAHRLGPITREPRAAEGAVPRQPLWPPWGTPQVLDKLKGSGPPFHFRALLSAFTLVLSEQFTSGQTPGCEPPSMCAPVPCPQAPGTCLTLHTPTPR
ncbi:DNA (cytosine-5)-methyltransferase 3-like isoform 2-T2 [Dama dama]